MTKNFLIFSQSISPGRVKTEIVEASGFPKGPVEHYKDVPFLEAKDIADSVLFVLGAPPHVQVRVWTLNNK
jgi:NADP-dependent 3-hydroxy acid dehydrogenase YdfG